MVLSVSRNAFSVNRNTLSLSEPKRPFSELAGGGGLGCLRPNPLVGTVNQKLVNAPLLAFDAETHTLRLLQDEACHE